MFAFEVGETMMRSATFEVILGDLKRALTNPEELQVVDDALIVNCLWVDKIPPARKPSVLSALYRVLDDHMSSGAHVNDETALIEIRALRHELQRRYPQML